MKSLWFKIGLYFISKGSKALRDKWAKELKGKGLLTSVLICLIFVSCGCSDAFKLWYVNTYDDVTGYEEPTTAPEAFEDDAQDMINNEPRLAHIKIDREPTIAIQGYDAKGVSFKTETFGYNRNSLKHNYETLVLTRFKDGKQKVFGTSWPATDSRAFRDETHSFKDVDRFMVVLNKDRVDGETGRVIGKAKLVEYSKVVKL